MSASWYWARASLRRNLGGVALLAIVLAIGAGGAMGAAAGARRGASASDRLAERSAVPEALVYANDAATFDAVTDLPEVAAVTGFAGVGLQPQQVPCSDEDSSYFPTVVQVAGEPFAVPRPRLMAGRFADQADPSEAVLSEQHARRLGVGVGDRVRYLPFLMNDRGEPVGCGEDVIAEVTVVGIVRELFEIGSDEPTRANTYLTAAFPAAHPTLPNPGYSVVGFVDLVPGTDAQAFADNVAQRAPADENGEPLAGTVIGMSLGTNALQPALDAGAAGLWALAAVVALVAATVLAVGIARQAASAGAELRLLAVIGMRRRDRVAAAAALGVAVVCVGLPLAMALAATLSTVHLVGLAAIVEPEPGFDLDLGVLVVGVLAAAAIVGGTVAVIAVRASAAAGRLASDEGSSARPGIAERLGSVGAPPWAVLGTSYALGRGRGTRVPARSALVGVLVGTAGGLAVLLFGLGVSRASTDPSVYGWGTWDAFVSTDDDEATPDADSAEVLLGDRDVATVALVQIRFKLELDGEVTNGLPVENLRGRSGPTVVDGRLPVGPSEIALGSDTADSLQVHIGSSIDVAGPDGTAPLEVVGIVAFVGFDGDPLASGWTTDRAAIDALGWPPGCNDEAECFQTVVAGWRDGVDDDALLRRLSDAGLSVDRPHPGGEVLLIAEADGLPGVAAGVVALVAAVGLAHTLTVTAARRRRELAVVRSLGFDRAQVRRVLHAEGLVLGVVGGLVGCVAGVVVGGLAWRAAARSIGIGPALPSAASLVAAVFAVVVALGLVLSIIPARLASRASPAEGLRDP